MRIIDVPSAKPWCLACTCGNCHTRVEVEIGDFKKTFHDQRDGSAAVFVCPTSGREVWVDYDRIPPELRHKLP